MAEGVVHLDDVSLVRDGRRILGHITWRIERGRHWALLGANGSGKTSLLKVILGYEWPSHGRVRVLGQCFGQADIPRLRRRIGWVSNALTTRLNGRECAWEVVAGGLDASLQLYRDVTDEERAKVRRALAITGALACEHQRYELLSQGEQQRVLIARALVQDPAVLILDEPCVGLDPAARERFLRDQERLASHADSPVIVWVTHHVEELRPWIRHALVLKEGQVLACGSIEQVLRSEVLARAFDCDCRLVRENDVFRLICEPENGAAADRRTR